MLRWIFILLVLINILVAAFFYKEIASVLSFQKDDPQQPIEAEEPVIELKNHPDQKVEITASQEVIRIAAQQPSCIEIRNFRHVAAMRSTKEWLKESGLFARERTRIILTEQTHRVYVDGFTSKVQVDKGLRLLQENNADVFSGSLVYQNAPSDWRISLGIFLTKDEAQNYIATIRKKIGRLDANIDVNNKGDEDLYLVLTGATAEKFIEKYNTPKWKQRLLNDRVQVDQCVIR